MEYSIHQRELTEVAAALEQVCFRALSCGLLLTENLKLEEERADGTNTANAAREAAQQRTRDLSAAADTLSEKQQELDLLKLEKRSIASDKKEAVKAKTQVECIVRDLSDASASSAATREQLQADLVTLQERIDAKQVELDTITPELDAVTQDERDLKAQLEDAQTRVAALYSKQGRSKQYRTQKERDAFLNAEIDKLNLLVPDQERKLEHLDREIGSLQTAVNENAEAAEEIQRKLNGRVDELTAIKEDIASKNATKLDKIEERKCGFLSAFS